MNRRTKPLGDGWATDMGDGAIEATFALSEEMSGMKMTSAVIDPTGYFLTIRWEDVDEDAVQSETSG